MLTRGQVENWQSSHLDQAALQLHSLGRESESVFGQHVRNLAAPGGSDWQGQAHDAAQGRGQADMSVVRRQADVMEQAGQIAQRGAADIAGAKTNVLEAIAETEADGFKVGDDLSVTDTRSASDDQHQRANREAVGRQHAEYIRFRAAQLAEADEQVGRQLKEKAGELEGTKFDGQDGTVRAMDHGTPEPKPGDPPTKTAKDVRAALDPLPRGDGKSLTRDVRTMPSSNDVVEQFRSLTEGAPKGTSVNYPGDQRVLRDGTIIGLRDATNSGGPGIDVRYPDGQRQFVHVSKEGLAGETHSGGGGGGGGATSGRGGGAAPIGGQPPIPTQEPKPGGAMPVGPGSIPSQVHPEIGHHGIHVPSPIEPGGGIEADIEGGG